MVTRDELSKMLQGVNVEAVAKVADVSTKTIYRMRQNKRRADGTPEVSPTLDTIERVVDAVRKITGRKVAK